MSTRATLAFALIALLYVAVGTSAASSILGSHAEGSLISPSANAYRSRRTLMPFNYYMIPVCTPTTDQLKQHGKEDIGGILTGNRLVPTLFEFTVGTDEKCKRLCSARFTKNDVRRANYMIYNKYDVRMFLDGNPLVSTFTEEGGSVFYRKGYSLGTRTVNLDAKKTENHIYNHLDFTIRYTYDVDQSYVITGFHVTPRSYASVGICSTSELGDVAKNAMTLPTVASSQDVSVPYTYSVTWEENSSSYVILHSVEEAVQKRGHKIAAMYGVLLTVLAGVVVAFVMLRTVRKDLAVYLDEELNEIELREESGWKLVRGDVFRPPPYAVVLSTFVGAGCQIAVTVFVTVLLCATGGVNPTIRGHFLTTTIIVFLLMHIVAGFVTSRLLKLFGMDSWKTAMLCVAAFPLTLSAGVLTLNFMHWFMHSTAAIPLGTIVSVALVWVLVSIPFGAAGVFIGYSLNTIAVTAKVSSIPRLIPAEAGSRTLFVVIVGSLVPFVACCVELSYVLNAFWREEQMSMYGMLAFFLCTVVVLCVEVGIVVTYITLRGEDYRWWWRSFGSLAATGVYVFFYSIFFLKHSLQIRLVASVILFLAYMFGVSVMFGLALGAISFLGSLWLVQRMYDAIKAD
ncbi:transmembrane/endomembrane-like protein [Leptomonas pyrrhocoris]|uniref:Transmembrane 9 superfamily member n=1 Tax=Leptomonas pyrrhocoris TaxID=157538 RepID=A0A0N0DX20_LEPPY|nr:transmembrane/endomembrane-like protein [Leptomonas pyrrhocoris]KPA82468.1 transmembrane/endomembrane-like protein [Leptomonas pyrrhocoris]|eukprot:XP_015660907.1 transmembrane/endomembrane-like protein [Leptomonas pyrrhocoris]